MSLNQTLPPPAPHAPTVRQTGLSATDAPSSLVERSVDVARPTTPAASVRRNRAFAQAGLRHGHESLRETFPAAALAHPFGGPLNELAECRGIRRPLLDEQNLEACSNEPGGEHAPAGACAHDEEVAVDGIDGRAGMVHHTPVSLVVWPNNATSIIGKVHLQQQQHRSVYHRQFGTCMSVLVRWLSLSLTSQHPACPFRPSFSVARDCEFYVMKRGVIFVTSQSAACNTAVMCGMKLSLSTHPDTDTDGPMEEFLRAHGAQLASAGIPKHLHLSLHRKLQNEVGRHRGTTINLCNSSSIVTACSSVSFYRLQLLLVVDIVYGARGEPRQQQ